jgi:LmbE family N-acetylglucosaminyl deacetylase
MGIGAHQDDLEVMALDGILQCYNQPGKWFMGVVVTNGAGAPRSGLYAAYSDGELQETRRAEQRKAAYVGEFAACAQLMYTSAEIKSHETSGNAVSDIVKILTEAQPNIVYTHNLADKHDTHVAVALRVIQAIRSMPPAKRPDKLYGCEVWRGLDWLNNNDKTILNVSSRPNLSASLIGLYDSQIQAKRYDNAASGRRRANATFLDSHYTDIIEEAVYALDMSAFITDGSLCPSLFIEKYIDNFKIDVSARIEKLS